MSAETRCKFDAYVGGRCRLGAGHEGPHIAQHQTEAERILGANRAPAPPSAPTSPEARCAICGVEGHVESVKACGSCAVASEPSRAALRAALAAAEAEITRLRSELEKVRR